MTIRPARELAQQLANNSGLSFDARVDALTAAIEADRREVVEACAVALGPCGHLECDRLGDYDGCQRLRAIAIAKEKTT